MSIKMLVWDLDDTLWRGILADNESVELHLHRAELIKALNRRGVLSSICSKNDFELAKQTLQSLGLWSEFVFPHIALEPKSSQMAALVRDVQLRPENILFIDDNINNLEEVKFSINNINILDIGSKGADEVLMEILNSTPNRYSNRLAEYKILESRARDRRIESIDHENFLRVCRIEACAVKLMDNLEFLERIEELINRSNQLNYTSSRVEAGTLHHSIIDVVRYDSWSIFVWDRYGYHGLVGFVLVDRSTGAFVHFVFSCRVMHMGIEAYAYQKAQAQCPAADVSSLIRSAPLTMQDWIKDRGFEEQAVRAELLSRETPFGSGEAKLRIMFDCQSAGIAHFSRWRKDYDFDNNPRVFGLRMLFDGGHEDQTFPEFLVYGAGIDYADPRWPNRSDALEAGLYAEAIDRMRDFVRDRDRRLLVILPPDNLLEDKYRPHFNHTRDRTRLFNRMWGAAAENCDWISLLDLSACASDADVADVSHYYTKFLRHIADCVDEWYEQVCQ